MATQDGIRILYEDESCQVTDLYIKIYKYFFPLATSRTIMFSDIDKISLENAEDVSTLWGLSSHHMNNWFPLDKQRKRKPCFIAIHEKGERIIPSLTPKDASAVFFVLVERFKAMGKQHPVMEQNHHPEQDELGPVKVEKSKVDEAQGVNVDYIEPVKPHTSAAKQE